MKLLTVVVYAGLGLVYASMSDLAYFLLNNQHAVSAQVPIETTRALARFCVLPSKLLSLLRTSMDSGFSHSFLAHVARISVNNLDLAIKCVDENDGLKGFQMCMLKETGMNPHFLRLMECLPHYEKWHDDSPAVNGEQLLDGDSRRPDKIWSMTKFVESVMSGGESLTEGFMACLAHIEAFTVGFVIKDFFSLADITDEKELSILGVLGAHEDVLCQVPLPLALAPIKKPSHLIPLIIRHFVSRPKYQSILDHMTYDWSLMPLDTLEMMLSHISLDLKNWPMTTQLSPRFKYFDYSYNSPSINKSWWNTFYGTMKSDDVFIESLILATSKSLKLPQNDLPTLKAACENCPGMSLPDILDALRGFRNLEIEKDLVAIGIQPEGHWMELRLCDWSAYKPRLGELGPKIQRYFDMTHSDVPSNPDNLDIFMVKSFLDQTLFQNSLNLAIVALHPFFVNRRHAFMKVLMEAIMEGNEEELLDKLWSLNNESVWNGTLVMDLHKFLKLPEVVDLRGSLDEVKQRMHASLVLAISAKGGADFAVLDYKNALAFPEIIQILLDIHNQIDQNRGMAYLLAVGIPIFANPALPPQVPKTSLLAVAVMCDPYVSSLANDPILVALLRLIFETAFVNASSQLALYALDFNVIKALVELSRVDAKAFTYAIVRSPNFIHPLLWPDIAARLLYQLNFPLENLTGFENLIDFDSTLNFLRAKTNSAKVDLDKVFFSEEDSLKILKANPDICAVCQGEFLDHEDNLVEGEPFGALHPCKHLYHRTCFKYAAANQVKVTCPMCAQPVVEVQNS